MKKAYIDFDDVLCKTAEAIVGIVKDRYGIKRDFDNITDFNLQKSFDLTDQQFTDLISLIHDVQIIYDMTPIEGALDSVRQLKDKGYEIAIMTGRPPSTKDASIKWLNDYQVPYDSLAFVDKYARFDCDQYGHDGMTLEELTKQKFSFAIEDSATMATFLSTEMNLPVFLHDRPWNRHLETNSLIMRCMDWGEIMGEIEDLRLKI